MAQRPALGGGGGAELHLRGQGGRGGGAQTWTGSASLYTSPLSLPPDRGVRPKMKATCSESPSCNEETRREKTESASWEMSEGNRKE